MQDLLPEDGRITVTRFDELVATLARTKTQAEKSRKETLKAAMAVRNGNQVLARGDCDAPSLAVALHSR
jgi:hypothetical protein